MFSLKVLGALELHSPTGEEHQGILGGQKLVALLTYLAVARPAGLQRRDTVVALLWPELDQQRARAALRHSVFRIRRALQASAIVSRGDEDLGLDPSVVRCDVVDFEHRLEHGDVAGALAVYRGDLLPGFFLTGAPEFERWLDEERSRLRARASEAAWRYAQELSSLGRGNEAAALARRAAALAPDDEQMLRRLLALLAASGDTGGALRDYEAFARRLAAEYDARPSAETLALVERLRRPVVSGDVLRVSTGEPATPAMGPEASRDVATVQPAHMDAVTPASGRSPRTKGWFERRWMGAVAAVAVILSGIALRERPWLGGDEAMGNQATIAVLPFEVRGDRDLGYLSEGMSDLLSIGLDGVAGMQSADPRLVLTALRTEGEATDDGNTARRIAAKVGATLYVTGSVVEAGGTLTLTAALHERDGRVRATARSRTGEVARLFELVDDLTRQLMAGSLGTEANALVSLAVRTTPSVSAVRSFLEGEYAIRRGRHAEALERFQQAIGEDSTFALAYYRLGAAGRWMTDYALATDAAEKAARYGRTLPSYVRRLLSATQAIHRGAYAEAESLYKVAVTSRPSDVDAWFALGDLYYHYNALRGESKGASRLPFERALAIDPQDGQARLHLLEVSVWEGKARQVDSLLQGLNAGSDFASKWPYVRALIERDSAAEARIASTLRTLDDRGLVRVVIHSASSFPSNLPGAMRVLSLLTEPTRASGWRAYGHQLRAQVELARGRWGAARAELVAMGALEPAAATEYGALFSVAPFVPMEPAALRALRDALVGWDATPTPPSSVSVFAMHDGMHPQIRFYLLGLVNVRLSDSTAALQYTDSLVALPADSVRTLVGRNLAGGIRARVSQMRGDPRRALLELGEPWLDPRVQATHRSALFAQVADRFLRAELLRESGRLVEAAAAYGAVADYSVDGLMYAGPAHRHRAAIFQQLGDRERAAMHLRRFVELWNGCDPELRPQRDAAERRLKAKPA